MKVINWLFGGFFRTIGRTLAFLVMGALLYYILSINDIGVKDLFFENVKAESYTSGVWSNYWRNANTKLQYESDTGYYTTQTTNFPVYLFFNNQISQSGGGLQLPSNATRVRFHLRISSFPLTQGGTLSIYNSYTIGTYYDKGGLTYCDTVQANNYNKNDSTYTNQLDLTLDCPIVKTSSYLSVIFIRGVDSSSGFPFKIDINPNYTFEYDDAAEGIQGVIQEQQETTDAINNQSQQQHQDSQNTQNAINNGINQTIETITDNELNDTEIENQLQFEVPSTSMGPFSGFITLPLTWVQNILAANQVCHKLELPLPFINKTLDLPCMQEFWSRMGLLSTLIQLCWLAVVGVRIFNGLYLLVVDIKSPNANADQLTKIRSWEL